LARREHSLPRLQTQILACFTEGMSIRRTERKRADNPGNKTFMLEMAQSWIRLAEQAKEKGRFEQRNAET
jgi:hypothetical protein